MNTENNVAALAITGGKPRFAEPLHVGRPNMGDTRRILEKIEGLIERRWLTNDRPSGSSSKGFATSQQYKPRTRF